VNVMDQKSELTITFEGLKGHDATLAAEELKQAIEGLGESDLNIETRRERAGTQDFGATLVLVFGTPVAIALARGIAGWLRRRADTTTVVIRDKKGRELLRYNGDAKELDKLAAVMRASH
jgi:Effector Associated Constant Component 1